MAYQGFYARLEKRDGRLCCPLCEFTAGANAREVMLNHLRTVHHRQPDRMGNLHEYVPQQVIDLNGLPAPAWIAGGQPLRRYDDLAHGLPVCRATERDGTVYLMLR